MGLFKDVYCSHCGAKASLLTRMKLADGSYLCSQCVSNIPDYMKDSVSSHYGIQEYRALLTYIGYSACTLRPQFHETHSYYSIHIDTENKILYLGYGINDKTVFIHLKNIDDFNLTFRAEEFKEGMLGDKVKGALLMTIKAHFPYFYHEEILDYSAKAAAKKKFLSSSVEYNNPCGMDEFLLYFQTAWQACLEESAYARFEKTECSDYGTPANELQQAMALFMLDSLTGVTLDEIKSHRNRLIKAFHPDLSSAADTAYAQKINNAFEVLKQHLS